MLIYTFHLMPTLADVLLCAVHWNCLKEMCYDILVPLYLLDWTAMAVIGPGGQIYVILFILFVANLVKGFDNYLVYKGVQMYK